MSVFDKRQCALGEGPLWHPERKQLFWFDILGKRLLSRTADGPLEWRFQSHVAVAGWVDHDTLIIVSETTLLRFDIPTGKTSPLLDLEADKPATRPHDGRADPFGGLWIGTIGKGVEAGAGSLYRYYRGEITQLKTGMTLPNSICFSPDGRTAYYAETTDQRILRQPLDAGLSRSQQARHIDTGPVHQGLGRIVGADHGREDVHRLNKGVVMGQRKRLRLCQGFLKFGGQFVDSHGVTPHGSSVDASAWALLMVFKSPAVVMFDLAQTLG